MPYRFAVVGGIVDVVCHAVDDLTIICHNSTEAELWPDGHYLEVACFHLRDPRTGNDDLARLQWLEAHLVVRTDNQSGIVTAWLREESFSSQKKALAVIATARKEMKQIFDI